MCQCILLSFDNFNFVVDLFLEEKYGKEIRARFGDETIDASNRKVMNLTRLDYEDTKTLETRLNETIRKAFETGDPCGPLAMETAALHRLLQQNRTRMRRVLAGCDRGLRRVLTLYCEITDESTTCLLSYLGRFNWK